VKTSAERWADTRQKRRVAPWHDDSPDAARRAMERSRAYIAELDAAFEAGAEQLARHYGLPPESASG
jgi:hypothetical protein